ncbi:MAG: DinB family protein [Sphingobacteriales bacterium]|nr:MAG: DinB family protein [Sphingobacteriales bacterium]
MNTTKQIAKHLRDVHFGGNWTCVNLKDTLKDVDWQLAIRKQDGFNTIVALAYHINYYVDTIKKVLQGNALDAHDKYSFDHPVVNSEADWQQLLEKAWADATACADLIEQLPDSKLEEFFTDEKYGTYYRNFAGMIEHTHYHLGQIVIIKKMLLKQG